VPYFYYQVITVIITVIIIIAAAKIDAKAFRKRKRTFFFYGHATGANKTAIKQLCVLASQSSEFTYEVYSQATSVSTAQSMTTRHASDAS
jgi:hypothetical protein